MADMKAFNERFKVERVNASGDTDRVTVQVGLEGLKILNADGTRTTNSYELSHISRWSMRGNSLILYTKTPVDVEERQITFRSNETMIRNVMDTLTCCCMQLCEILQSNGKSSSDKETANSLHQLVKGNGKKVPSLPSVDEVEFWHNAEKQGYLQSQGDHTKFWRRRFFVMKQGYLFRFMNGDLSESTKPRGVVDLSKVTDVIEGRATTGKGNSIKLCTATGSVCYVADSETEMVEWMSALEGAVQRIVKHVAGFADDDSPTHHQQGASSAPNDWVKQLQSSIGASSSSSAAAPFAGGRYAMVDIVGYDSAPATAPPAHHASSTSYGANNNPYGGSIDYSQIAGVAGVAGDTPSADPTSDLLLNYGAPSTQAPHSYPSAYPTSTPSSTSYPTAAPQQQYYPSYPTQQQQQQQQQQQPSYQAPSLLDQLPSQAPSYPYYQQPAASSYTSSQQAAASSYPSSQQAAALAPQGPPANGSWQVLYTPEGKTYYHNPTTGSTQWEAPPGY